MGGYSFPAHPGAVPGRGARAVGVHFLEGGCLRASPLPQGPQRPHHLPGALSLLGWMERPEPCMCPAESAKSAFTWMRLALWQMPAKYAEHRNHWQLTVQMDNTIQRHNWIRAPNTLGAAMEWCVACHCVVCSTSSTELHCACCEPYCNHKLGPVSMVTFNTLQDNPQSVFHCHTKTAKEVKGLP